MSVEAIFPHSQAGGAAATSNRVAREGVSVNTPQALEQRAESVSRLEQQEKVLEVQPTQEAINEEVNLLNNLAGLLNHKLSFVVSKEMDDSFIRVVDKETGDVVREIPPDKLRTVSKKIRELVGVFFEAEG